MAAFVTTEVRWFCAGSMPPQVLAWFHIGEQAPQEQPPRVDYYLDVGEYDSLGIKLREGRIEIKQREAQHGTVPLGAQFAGVMERWRKWSLPLAEVHGEIARDWISSPAWIGVEKKRWLFTYQIRGEADVAPAPDAEAVEQGCQVELAQIRARGHAGWSFSFEGFGSSSAGREILIVVANHLLSGKQTDLPFHAENSYGYPRWLAILQSAVPF